MKINETEYGFTIIPNHSKVVAEIYEISKFRDGEKIKFIILSKEFGSLFRGQNESDYKKARNWIDLQMKYIFEANKK